MTHEKPTAPQPASVDAATENLRFAITDHQETIRGTDFKAEVLGIAVTGLLAIVTLEGAVSLSGWNGQLGIAGTLTSLAALAFVGLVLWPRTTPWKQVRLGGYKPSGVLYPPAKPDASRDVPRMTHDALAADWPSELTFELSKLAVIRGAKQMWFKWALAATGLSILAIAIRLFFPVAGQVVR